MNYPLVFVTALHCEAKPLIAFYRLKHEQRIKPFKVFCNGACWLIVSGIGKVAAASAVSFMAGWLKENAEKTLWMNVGIARHPLLDIGKVRWVNKVVDEATGQASYPLLCVRSPFLSASCLTVDRVSLEPSADYLLDMEASGFMAAASRYSTLECVHLLKVVSDNGQQSKAEQVVSQVTAEAATALVAEMLDIMQGFVRNLSALRDTYWQHQDAALPYYTQILAMQRFSQSTKIQLLKQVKKIVALRLADQLDMPAMAAMRHRREVLLYLQRLLDEVPVMGMQNG